MPYVRRGLGSTVPANLSPVQQQIVNYAQSIGLDPSLALAVAQQESRFNSQAKSSAGAIGLFQLMPATAASLGVDPTDPTQNIQGGENYLKSLLAQYNGDVTTALWAYNAGPGNVAAGNLPSETQNYIPSVLNYQASYSGLFPSPESAIPDAVFAGAMDNTPVLVGAGLALAVLLAVAVS